MDNRLILNHETKNWSHGRVSKNFENSIANFNIYLKGCFNDASSIIDVFGTAFLEAVDR